MLAAMVFVYLGTISEDLLLGWVWRIAFLASFPLILVPLFIRLRVRESPTFIALEKQEQIAEHPLREIFGHSLPSVLPGIGLRMAENGGSYLSNSLAVAYATGTDEVIAALADGTLQVESVITHEFAATDALEAFEVARDSARSSRVLLRF